MFSKLALIAVDRELSVRHFMQIFNGTSVLVSFIGLRITLYMFLSDCYPTHDYVTARQPLASVQLMLLGYQYQ